MKVARQQAGQGGPHGAGVRKPVHQQHGGTGGISPLGQRELETCATNPAAHRSRLGTIRSSHASSEPHCNKIVEMSYQGVNAGRSSSERKERSSTRGGTRTS